MRTSSGWIEFSWVNLRGGLRLSFVLELEDASGAAVTGGLTCMITELPVQGPGSVQVVAGVLPAAQLREGITEVAVGERLPGAVARSAGGRQPSFLRHRAVRVLAAAEQAPREHRGELPGVGFEAVVTGGDGCG
jgi:hypothetical protein